MTSTLTPDYKVEPTFAPGVNIVPVLSGSPFAKYPQLRTIWASSFKEMAEEASEADSGTGQVLLIVKDDTEVIGITGVFDDDDLWPGDILLRWHGIVPQLRGKGYGRDALELLITHVCHHFYPERRRLVEFVPHTDNGRKNIAPFFKRCNFVDYGPLVDLGYGPKLWQPVSLDIGIA